VTTMPENVGFCFQVQRAANIIVFLKLTKEMFDRVEFVYYLERNVFQLL